MGRCGMIKRIKIILEMIKFPHTIFALPFAFTGAVLAAQGLPSWRQILWILVAMVGARSGAMGMNRLLDAEIDARNPRTKTRAIPAGLLTKAQVGIFSLASYALLVLAAYMLNPLCFKLSPVVIAVLTFYSVTKRFTWATHLFLGLALGLAPVGAWAAIRGTIDLPVVILALSVLAWVAGFDILYALQDLEFDRNEGLHSIPRYLGINKSLWVSRLLHALAIAGLIAIYRPLGLNFVYLIGVFAASCMLVYEHMLIRGGDLKKLDAAFFNMNGYISVTVFLFTAGAVFIK
jgi:4-hydroxybenzoate polyprenyltransferase